MRPAAVRAFTAPHMRGGRRNDHLLNNLYTITRGGRFCNSGVTSSKVCGWSQLVKITSSYFKGAIKSPGDPRRSMQSHLTHLFQTATCGHNNHFVTVRPQFHQGRELYLVESEGSGCCETDSR